MFNQVVGGWLICWIEPSQKHSHDHPY